MPLSPVHLWTAAKTGLHNNLTPAALLDYQLSRMRETLTLAKRGIYYGALLKNFELQHFNSLDDFQRLPFTTASDIQKNAYDFLCVSQSNISRIITLNTSGTKGQAKRIFFTENDLELCIDFFANGMLSMVNKGDTAGIFLGPEIPGGTVNLLNQALKRIGVTAFNYALFTRPFSKDGFGEITKAACLVGLPVNLLQLAKAKPELRPLKVLLCSDYAPLSIIAALKKIWGCEVFSHYGSTESGLGGGVECGAHLGYHLRDADLFFEVIDPRTGRPVPSGVTGEVVFTTLSREAMPLIRYRTGDLAAMVENPCPCGSTLPRLSRIAGRFGNLMKLPCGKEFSIHQLDEIMFGIEAVYDYSAALGGDHTLELMVELCHENNAELERHIREALNLPLKIELKSSVLPFWPTTKKRTIQLNLKSHSMTR